MTLRQRHMGVKRIAPIDIVTQRKRWMGETICAYRLAAIWSIWN